MTINADAISRAPLNIGEITVLSATNGATDATQFIAENRQEISNLVTQQGAILLRGFKIDTVEDFESASNAFSDQLIDYVYRSTPRTHLGKNIYTSTEYPADQEIQLHNENSYSSLWPHVLMLCCLVPAAEGGETPLCDSRNIFNRLSDGLKAKFVEKGVMYVRNYQPGLDVPWQTVFQTENRSDVDSFCKEQGIEVEWLSDEHLRTRQVLPATVTHPVTGETSWFNQAHLFHMSSLDEGLQEVLVEQLGKENLPRNTYYGDGSDIELEYLEEIRAAYEAEKRTFPWQQGDMAIVDNILFAHGRLPFKGERKVVVSMA